MMFGVVTQRRADMSDHIQKTIEEALVKLREQEQQVIKTKTLINSLREWAGQPALFPDSETNSSTQTGPLRRDEYYGQALSTVVREVLVKRREAGLGPASVDEIYHAMLEGGYAFETSNEENAKRGLRISLTKNSATFHRLPQGGYGLKEWYPNIKESKARTSLTSAAN